MANLWRGKNGLNNYPIKLYFKKKIYEVFGQGASDHYITVSVHVQKPSAKESEIRLGIHKSPTLSIAANQSG